MKKIFLAFLLLGGLTAAATPTRLIVRVKAKDAKFIGTGIGGAFVQIKNPLTGETLAKGLTTGSSGSTPLIMSTAHQRNQRLTDEKTAGYEAVLDITEPVLVEIVVTAPVSRKNAAITGSTQVWLIPGKHIDGEGLVIELPGYILDILQPTTHAFLSLPQGKPLAVDLQVSLTMLCGCTITKGGTWDANAIEVTGILYKEGKPLKELRLQPTDTPNIFSLRAELTEKGSYGFTVFAYDAQTHNTGVDKVNFVIQ